MPALMSYYNGIAVISAAMNDTNYRICGILGSGFNLVNHVNIAKLNVHHLGCKHGFLSIQYSKPPIKNLANCIFRVNRQIFDSPIILPIR